jgi:hypothetical protein
MSAVAANDELKYIIFEEGKGFTLSEADGVVSVGLRKGSTLCDKMNEFLNTFSDVDRTNLMTWAVEHQPLSEGEE